MSKNSVGFGSDVSNGKQQPAERHDPAASGQQLECTSWQQPPPYGPPTTPPPPLPVGPPSLRVLQAALLAAAATAKALAQTAPQGTLAALAHRRGGT